MKVSVAQHTNLAASAAAVEPPGTAEPGDSADLAWSSHPLAQEPPARSALLCALIAGVSLMAGLTFHGPGYGLISLAVLVGSLSRYFLPTRYRLDAAGVRASHLGRSQMQTWEQIRRADLRRDGVFLSPFPRPSRLDSFRGVYLRFHANRDQVRDFVQAHVPAASL